MEVTEGYKAQEMIENIIYNDTDFFKKDKIIKAEVLTLKSAFDEIDVYWDEEIRFRPKFSVENDIAKIPVFFAQVYGVPGTQYKYFRMIKKLNTKDTFALANDVIKKTSYNWSKNVAIKFKTIFYSLDSCFSNEKLCLKNVKNSKLYKYSYLSQKLQDHLLDKLKYIIDYKIIKGTFINGSENNIIISALSMPREIMKLYKNFDFTKKNPKLVYVSNLNGVMPLQDVVYIMLCHYIGFDVVIFSPNGANLLGDYIDSNLINHYHIGDNVDDLKIPNLYLNIGDKLWDLIFRN